MRPACLAAERRVAEGLLGHRTRKPPLFGRRLRPADMTALQAADDLHRQAQLMIAGR